MPMARRCGRVLGAVYVVRVVVAYRCAVCAWDGSLGGEGYEYVCGERSWAHIQCISAIMPVGI